MLKHVVPTFSSYNQLDDASELTENQAESAKKVATPTEKCTSSQQPIRRVSQITQVNCPIEHQANPKEDRLQRGPRIRSANKSQIKRFPITTQNYPRGSPSNADLTRPALIEMAL
jgi:hypothetical protein